MKIQRLSIMNRGWKFVCSVLRYKITRGASVQQPSLGYIQRSDGAVAPSRIAVTKPGGIVTLRQQCLSTARRSKSGNATSRVRYRGRFLSSGCIFPYLVCGLRREMSPFASVPITALSCFKEPSTVVGVLGSGRGRIGLAFVTFSLGFVVS